MMNMNEVVNNVTLAKACTISPDKDSNESKAINLRIKFDGVTLNDVFAKAVSSAVIQWQNGPGRKQFTSWTDKQVVEIDFKAPGRMPQVDPETAMVQRLQAMTPAEQMAYLKELAAKASK